LSDVEIISTEEGGERPRLGLGAVVLVVALWGVWVDYVRRLRTGIDEPWGLLALGVAAGVVISRSRADPGQARGYMGCRFRVGWGTLGVVWLLVVTYAAAREVVPPLVRGVIAMTAVAALLSRLAMGRRFDLALWGLLVFSLPLSSALQFYLGYPIRSATAMTTAPLLRVTGLAVERAGTVLQFGGRAIWIDAPCSGVKMLWTGMFLALALAAILRVGNWRTVVAAALALVAVFVGNVVRSTGLFYLEAGIFPAPHWYHNGIGLVAFAMTAGGIAWCVVRMGRRSREHAQTRGGDQFVQGEPTGAGLSMAPGGWMLAGHLIVCAGVAIYPLVRGGADESGERVVAGEFGGWPSEFEGRALREEALAEREAYFLRDFPGKVAKFSDGRRQFIFRWTNVATRKLHLSSDCFRGAGFEITPQPALGGEGGGPRYSRFIAVRGEEKLMVSERIYDEAGSSWPDVSSWYWAAVTRRTSGPWWGVTVVEAADQS
jgi:exosortase/archaeosortase family protein